MITDGEGGHFTNTTFIGPFEPDFYLGAPSLSVRWHAYSYPHRLPDGGLEMYNDAEDYIQQTLREVYGNRVMSQPPRDIIVHGKKARHFVVLSPAPVPPDRRWGVVEDAETGKPVNLREHAYVVVALKRGFYVLIYPATRAGFKKYEPHFNQLVNTFKILKEGPDGAAVEWQGPAPARQAGKRLG